MVAKTLYYLLSFPDILQINARYRMKKTSSVSNDKHFLLTFVFTWKMSKKECSAKVIDRNEMKSIASEKNYSINDECCSSQSLTSAFVHEGQNWLQGKKVGTKNHLPNVVYSNQERKNRNYKKRSRVEIKVGTNNAKTNLSALIRRKDYDEKKKKKNECQCRWRKFQFKF